MTSRTTALLAGAAGFVFIIATGQSQAAQIDVSATVPASCSVDETSSPTLAFGEYDAANGNTASTSFLVFCSEENTVVNVTLDGGAHSNGTRRMAHATDPTEFLGYVLYNGSVEGNDSWLPNTSRSVASGTGGASVTVAGSISSELTPQSGSYSDTVGITLQIQ